MKVGPGKKFKPSKRDLIMDYLRLYNEANRALDVLGKKHGKNGFEFWLESEEAYYEKEDYAEARRLRMRMSTCRKFIMDLENGDRE